MQGDTERFKKQGLDFLKSGEFETAIRYFTNAIVKLVKQKNDEQNSYLYFHRAECHKELEAYQKVMFFYH